MKRLDKSSETRGIDQSLNDAERAIEKTNDKDKFKRPNRSNRRRARNDSKTGSKDRSPRRADSRSSSINSSNLASQVASLINFNNPVGLPIFNVADTTVGTPSTSYAIPGVCRLHYIPTFGPSEDNRSPLNQAKLRLFTKVRQGNTSNQPYDAPDLMIAVLAVKSMLDMFMFAQRIYGMANNYSALNRYLPDALLAACHVDASLLRSNLADYHYRLNVLASQVNMLVIPKTLSIFTDGNDYLSRVYLDDPEVKAQCYIFCPVYYYTYQENSETGSKLVATKMEYDLKQFGDGQHLLDIISSQIDALLSSGTIGNIFGDMLRVFSDSELLRAAAVPVEYTVMPEYDVGMLTQINNASFVGGVSYPDLTVSQDPTTNAIVQRIQFTGAQGSSQIGALRAYLQKRHFVNVKAPAPDVADTYNATALQVQGFIQGDSTDTIQLRNYGFVVLDTYDIISMINSSGQYKPTIVLQGYTVGNMWSAKALSIVSKFDWFPIFPVYDTAAEGVYISDWFGDIANYTTLAAEDLAKFHEMRIMLAYGVPVI